MKRRKMEARRAKRALRGKKQEKAPVQKDVTVQMPALGLSSNLKR